MKQKNLWAAHIRSHRLTQQLSQAEFAAQLGVATPTISRWESGRQVPSLEAQKQIRLRIDLRQTMTEDAWRERVASAHSYEILYSDTSQVVAVSIGARRAQAAGTPDISACGMGDLFPGGSLAFRRELDRLGQKCLVEEGLFSGALRHVHFIADLRVEDRVVSRSFDIWPVLSSDGAALAHLVRSDLPLCLDPDLVSDTRITLCEVFRRAPLSEHSSRSTKRVF